jgi:hypothetical protein
MDTKNKRKMHYIDDTKDFFAGPELEHKHLDFSFSCHGVVDNQLL